MIRCFKIDIKLAMLLRILEALENLEKVGKILKSGGVIAVPTDTIYGVACLACNIESLKKIYTLKGRDTAKPLAISVGQVEDLRKYFNVLLENDFVFYT